MKMARLIAIVGLILLQFPEACAQDDGLQKREFQVRPDFLSLGGGSSTADDTLEDPFADDPAPTEPQNRATAQEILIAAGVTFSSGASATFDPETSELTVINTDVNLALVETFIEDNSTDVQRQIRLLVESITLPHDAAVRLAHEHMGNGDATELRNTLQEMVRGGTATVTASSMVTTRSGQRAKTKSVTEEIYPTEFDPGDTSLLS